MNQFDIETEVVYNKAYSSVEGTRGLLISLFRAMNNALFEDCKLRDIKERNETEIKDLEVVNSELKSRIRMINHEYNENLTKLRE